MNEAHHRHKNEREPEPGLVNYVQWIYGLHSLSILIGLLSSSTVAGKFLFGLPSIIAVIMNYARRQEARGSFLASHFRWQIRTFWVAFTAVIVSFIIAAPFVLLVIGIYFARLALAVIGLWVIYRIVRGWRALRHHRPLPYDPPPVTVG